MHRLTAPLAGLTALFALLPVSAGDFARILPADTFVFIESRDLPETTARYKATPLWESLQEFDWKNAVVFFAQLAELNESGILSDEELRSALDSTGSRLRKLSEHLSGDLTIAIHGFREVQEVFAANKEVRAEFFLDEIVEEELDENDPEFLAQLEREAELDAAEIAALLGTVSLLADVKEADVLEETLSAWVTELKPRLSSPEGKTTFSTFTRDGITFHSISNAASEKVPAVGLYWFVHEGVWAVAFTEQRIRSLAGDLRNPPAKSLAAAPQFQQSLRSMDGADSLTYMDLARLDDLIRAGLESASGDLPSAGSLTPLKFLDWLGLNALLPFTQGTRLDPEGFRTNGEFGFRRETGLSRIFLDEKTGDLPTPSFIHQNVPQFFVGNWHLGRFWTRLEQELQQLAPEAAAGLGMARMLAAGQLGFDIKLQFFDHLDSGLVFVQSIDPDVMAELQKAMASGDSAAVLESSAEHPTDGQNYLIGFQLKNEDIIRESIGRLMTRFFPNGAPEPELIDGVEVLNPVPRGAAGGMLDDFVTLAFVEGWLLVNIGERSLLEEAIAASLNPELQLWQQADFQSLRSKLPADADSYQYSSGRQQEEAMKIMQSSLRILAADSDVEVPDFSPLGSFVHQMLQTSTRNGLVISTESFMEFRK